MDVTAITTAVDFTTILAGMASVAAVLASVYVGRKGLRLLLGFLK